jgi:hypothetical protein
MANQYLEALSAVFFSKCGNMMADEKELPENSV